MCVCVSIHSPYIQYSQHYIFRFSRFSFVTRFIVVDCRYSLFDDIIACNQSRCRHIDYIFTIFGDTREHKPNGQIVCMCVWIECSWWMEMGISLSRNQLSCSCFDTSELFENYTYFSAMGTSCSSSHSNPIFEFMLSSFHPVRWHFHNVSIHRSKYFVVFGFWSTENFIAKSTIARMLKFQVQASLEFT